MPDLRLSSLPIPASSSRLAARFDALRLSLAALFGQIEADGGAAFLRSDSAAAPELDDAIFDRLARAFGLDLDDLDLVLLAGMPEQHEGYAAVLQSLHPRSEPLASVGLAAQLLCAADRPEPSADAAPRGSSGSLGVSRAALRRRLVDGPLVRAGLLQLRDDGPFFNRSMVLGAELWSLLCGCSSWPAALAPIVEGPDEVELSGFEHWLAEPAQAVALACLRAPDRDRPVLIVVADELRVARDRARALVAAAGRRAATFELSRQAACAAQRDIATQVIARDLVAIVGIEPPQSNQAELALPSFAASEAPVVLCTTDESLRIETPRGRGRATLTIPCSRLRPEALRAVWSAEVPELCEHAPALAARFPLEPGWIRDVAQDIRLRSRLDGRRPSVAEIVASVRTRVGTIARPGVRHRRPRVGWDRLILPPDRLELLHEAIARVRQQSRVLDDWGFLSDRPGARGVRMLFCGPPGTGKTLSAEVIAGALDTDLLVVDLSRLVSKWIGETEKNLAEVFAAAERAHAVLFFDEADALFAKRTEVGDAHDRYANLETAYLLGRLEQYEGLAILATNLRRNVDAAFMRRLEFVVDYERPGRAERLALWRAHLPKTAPLADDVDLRDLADYYPLVGGLIRNASVAAAFLAAEQRSAITRALLLRAIRREYEKSGAPFPGEPSRR